MKKIFTLMTLFCVALGMQAQGKYALTAGQGAIKAGTSIKTVSNITLTFGVAGEADFKDPKTDTRVDGYTAFTEGNGANGKEEGGTQYILAPALDGKVTVAVVLNANKSFFVTEDGTALEEYNGIQQEEKYYGTFAFDVKAGKTYKVYCTGSKLGFYGFEYEAEGGTPDNPDPVEQGETEKYSSTIVDMDGNVTFAPEYGDVCEPEYETVKVTVVDENGDPVLDENGDPVKEDKEQVKWYRATNVEDGRVVVKIATTNVDAEAVGGAVPAKNEDVSGFGGTQAIEADGTVTAWDPINWNLGNHRLDINDEAGTKFYTVMGSGNPYVELKATEVVKDGNPTGFYKADYVFYEPDGSLGLPIVGLYYRFMPKVNGHFRIQVWANKGNRKTFLVDEDTKQAIPYEVSGYFNAATVKQPQLDESGNPVLDDNGNVVMENVLNDEGKTMMYLHDNDSIQRLHQAEFDKRVANKMAADETLTEEDAKAQVEAEFPQWIIGVGNQAFWGWVEFDAQAGKKYWLFQHSSQIGFGGYEFTPVKNEQSGIKETVANGLNAVAAGKVFNLRGQEVDGNYRGIVVKDGKKFFQR